MKYNQSPTAGFKVASIAATPGLPIGPGGSPNLRYVLYGELIMVDLVLRKI
jgi:hypothetical protein